MENNYSIETNNLIALCHIIDEFVIDEFENFEKKLKAVISQKHNRNFVFHLWEISKGKFKIGDIKANKFYKENKSIIDTINKYSNISSFINLNYAYQGNPSPDLKFFYQYIKEHKNEIDKILTVLEKIKELGFTSVKFKENLDFTKEEYNIATSFRSNYRIIYIDNIEVIPNYESCIKYRTSDSNYKMELIIIGNEFSPYGRSITLNSLLFDLNQLPKRIDKESIFDPILKLKEEQKETSTSLRNSVDLSISIFDLETRLDNTANTITRLEGVKNKKELIEVLFNMKQDVEKLRTLSQEYDSSISENEPPITSELLEKEKDDYIRRREWRNLHID